MGKEKWKWREEVVGRGENMKKVEREKEKGNRERKKKRKEGKEKMGSGREVVVGIEE